MGGKCDWHFCCLKNSLHGSFYSHDPWFLSTLLFITKYKVACHHTVNIVIVSLYNIRNILVKQKSPFLPHPTFLLRVNYSFFFLPCCVLVAAHGLSLVAASGGYSSLRCAGFSLRWLLLLRSTGSRHVGFSSYSTQAQ